MSTIPRHDRVAYAAHLRECSAMKLTGLDLDHLRRGLRSHPRIAPEVAELDIERMRARELVALTTRFDLDARALIDTVREHDTERQVYSTNFLAFRGTLEFDLTCRGA